MDDTTADGDELDQGERTLLAALADGRTLAEIAAGRRVSEHAIGVQIACVLTKLHRHAARRRSEPAPAPERAPTRPPGASDGPGDGFDR